MLVIYHKYLLGEVYLYVYRSTIDWSLPFHAEKNRSSCGEAKLWGVRPISSRPGVVLYVSTQNVVMWLIREPSCTSTYGFQTQPHKHQKNDTLSAVPGRPSNDALCRMCSAMGGKHAPGSPNRPPTNHNKSHRAECAGSGCSEKDRA